MDAMLVDLFFFYLLNILINPGITHSVTLHSFMQCKRRNECSVTEWAKPGPEVMKLFPCSTQLSMKLILLINIKMPTIDGILTFVSMINTSLFVGI